MANPLSALVNWGDKHIPGAQAVDNFLHTTGNGWTFNLPGGGGVVPDAQLAAAVKAQAAAQAAAGSAAPATGTGQAPTGAAGGGPLADPLAVQLFFQHVLTPMLTQLTGQFKSTQADLSDQAKAALAHFQMPSAYRDIFSTMIPQQQAMRNASEQAIAGAAAAGPGLDALLAQLNQARQAATQDYMEQLKVEALGGGSAFSSLGLDPALAAQVQGAIGQGGTVPTNPYLTTPTTTGG